MAADPVDPNPMTADGPAKPAGKKTCGAKLRKKPGKRCKVTTGLMPNGRCRLHGGKTPAGPASPNWKHGQRARAHRWMASLPDSIGKRFDVALVDPQLADLRQDMALADAMLTSYTASLKDTGRPLTERQQNRVHRLIEMRARLAEREARRLRDLGTMVTQAQFLAVVNLCLALFIEYVPDLKARAEIQRRITGQLLVSGQQRPAVPAEGADDGATD